jgi:hypothetical protein
MGRETENQSRDRHRGGAIESLISLASCTRHSPNPPFAGLIGLR